jgi:protein AroM
VKTRLGMVTIGQAPREDVVPEMAELIGPGVEILEGGALDGLVRPEIARLAPEGDQEILVTRLADASSVFVAKEKITPLVQRRIDELEAAGAAMTVVLCTGAFKGLRANRALVTPEKVLVGVLRGVSFPGRLGVICPSTRHVPQTEARWRGHGFDPVVVPLSPYDHGPDPGAADLFREAGVGLVLLDCMGFRRSARRELQDALGVPLVVANLLVARVVGEMLGE